MMTVGQLIRLLEKHQQEAEVFIGESDIDWCMVLKIQSEKGTLEIKVGDV